LKKVLSQAEIDAILGRAKGEGFDPNDRRVVERCDFRNAGQMSEQQARIMTSVYEDFARNASNSLGAFLRARFELVLASVELMPVKDFLAGFQESGFVAFLDIEPGGSVALLQADTSLVSPVIDVLLGGFGTSASMSRELTEIDEDIMESVAQVVSRQLETTWQQLAVTISINKQRKISQVPSVYSPTEKLAILTFEAKINETAGVVNIAFPAALANAMLRGTATQIHRGLIPATEAHAGLQDRILNCQFDATVGVAELRVPLRELVGLKPGTVLNLRLPVKIPAALMLGGRTYFDACPVRNGKKRAAQLLRPSTASCEPM
jgi:flagellar motor switch protein FliM